MTQYAFGSGQLWGVSSATNPTPARFGAVQSVNIDFAATSKTLFGAYQLPLAVARGTINVTGKCNFAQLAGRVINDLFFNSTMATGQLKIADSEAGTVATNTVTVANSATFGTDLGVRDATTGIPYTRVASAPATGQYSVAAGVYTFAAGDNGKSVKIDYTYTLAGSGQKLTITNQLMGVAPSFSAVLTQAFNGVYTALQLNACTSTKLTWATQLEDFTKPEFDWGSFADSSNNLGVWSMAEAS